MLELLIDELKRDRRTMARIRRQLVTSVSVLLVIIACLTATSIYFMDRNATRILQSLPATCFETGR